MGEGGLPSTYQQVEYLQSTGTQYIDTNFNPTGATGIEISIGNVTANGVLFGAYNSTWTDGYGMYCNANSDFWYHYYSNTQISYPPPSSFVMLFGGGKTIINNSQKASTPEKSFTVIYPLYLMAGNMGGSVTQATQCKIYYAKIWDGDTLVRDYVPCYRKSDGIAGMYDKVTGTFFTNAGSGRFVMGSSIPRLQASYQQVEYLSMPDGTCINTGLSLTGGAIGEMRTNIVTGNFSNGGGLKDDTSSEYKRNYFSFYYDSGLNRHVIGIAAGGYNTTWTNYSLNTNYDVYFNTPGHYYILDGVTYSYSGTNWRDPADPPYCRWNWTIHGTPNDSGVIEPNSGESILYYYRLYNANYELLRDYVPCYRILDNKPGMYDLVTNTFYTNAGTGEFTVGADV